MLNVKKLHAGISGKEILKGVDLSIGPGEIHAVMGRNGSGKSTLLRIILGITSPSKGFIDLEAQELNISYLGHKNALKNYLTPAQNLELIFNDADLKLAFEWLKNFDLLDVQDELTANLSFGQQKKLALIRVMAIPSELIVLDEPFVGLDQVTADQLNNFLEKKLSNGVGLILTSHINPMIDCKVLDLGTKNA